jgi:hypothetical protein
MNDAMVFQWLVQQASNTTLEFVFAQHVALDKTSDSQHAVAALTIGITQGDGACE